MKKVVIASDSFKGSLSSAEVAEAASSAVLERFPRCEVRQIAVADGGEGTVEAIVGALNGHRVTVMVSDPLGRPVKAEYVIAGDTAIIETAAACGLVLLKPGERNPMNTGTSGIGEIILDAVGRGCNKFIIGLGGSATNDAGTGMLSALGVRFLDAGGHILEGRGATLEKIAAIDSGGIPQSVLECTFTVACDVDTPFCGPDGAAEIFAPQKGANPEETESLERGMTHFAALIKSQLGRDISRLPGAGAAGGLGGAFSAFLNANLCRGVDLVLDTIGFDSIVEGADLVITGEGRADSQTPLGKAAAGILKRATAAGVPAIMIAGSVDHCPALDSMGFKDIIQVSPQGMDLDEAMDPEVAKNNIRTALTAYFSFFIISL